MESGALVSDDIVVGIIEEAIKKTECRNGFILGKAVQVDIRLTLG